MDKKMGCFILGIGFILLSCTVNMTNVSSNGKSSDQVDTEQDASPDVKPTVTVPISPI